MNKNSFDITKLNKVIKSTEFKKMKDLEKRQGFTEAVIDKKTRKKLTFFNQGPKNDWRKYLNIENRLKIEDAFKNEMIELGYL